jgi:hypothetical protein
MVVISRYQTQIEADEDAALLMRKGIAAMVYGKAAPVVPYAGLESGPICVVVPNEQEGDAIKLLSRRQDSRRSFMAKLKEEQA